MIRGIKNIQKEKFSTLLVLIAVTQNREGRLITMDKQGLWDILRYYFKENLERSSMSQLTEYDGVSAEVEVGEFLYGFVRVLKPKLVVETGCYFGHTTSKLAQACWHNEMGKVISCDINPEYVEKALQQVKWLNDDIVEVRQCYSTSLPELPLCDFAFLDSEYALRIKEYELLKPGCVAVIHDTIESFDPQFERHHLGDFTIANGGLNFAAGRGFGVLVKR